MTKGGLYFTMGTVGKAMQNNSNSNVALAGAIGQAIGRFSRSGVRVEAERLNLAETICLK